MTEYAATAVPDAQPWGTTPDGELTSRGVIVGALLGTLAVFTCFPLAILGIVLNCMGLDRVQSDPQHAAGLLRASWILLACAPVVTVLLVVVLGSL